MARGAGAMFPASPAPVVAVTTTPRERAKAIVMWAGFLSAGAAVSPLLGASPAWVPGAGPTASSPTWGRGDDGGRKVPSSSSFRSHPAAKE